MGAKKGKQHQWTDSEIQFLRENREAMTIKELAETMGINAHRVKGACIRYGILTSKGYHVGQKPWNLGKRYHLRHKGSFQKGQRPHNYMPPGSIRQHRSGNQIYYWIKLEDSSWFEYHKFVWSKEHGVPVPHDHVITFKDGDGLNCEPSNLECISKAELAKRNHNPEKAGETLKLIWDSVKSLERRGVEVKFCKYRSKKSA